MITVLHSPSRLLQRISEQLVIVPSLTCTNRENCIYVYPKRLLRPPLRSRYPFCCSLRPVKRKWLFARGLLPRRIWTTGHFWSVPPHTSRTRVMDTNTQASWHVAYHRKSLVTDFSSLIDNPNKTIILCFSLCTSSQSRATLNWPSVEHHNEELTS